MKNRIPIAVLSNKHEQAIQTAIDAHAFFDQYARRLGSSEKNGDGCIACTRGCSYCCHLQVTATLSELLLIAGHIGTLPHETRTSLVVALSKAATIAAGLDASQRARKRIRCPLLDDQGACSIYAVRPTTCRAYVSFDVEACKADAQLPERSLPVPRSRELQQMRDELVPQILMHDARLGIDSRTFELIQGLNWLIGEPGRIADAASGRLAPAANP